MKKEREIKVGDICKSEKYGIGIVSYVDIGDDTCLLPISVTFRCISCGRYIRDVCYTVDGFNQHDEKDATFYTEVKK